jgi:hypothetical protein
LLIKTQQQASVLYSLCGKINVFKMLEDKAGPVNAVFRSDESCIKMACKMMNVFYIIHQK